MTIDFRDKQQRDYEDSMAWYYDGEEGQARQDKVIEEQEERKNRYPLFEGGK